jgi:hypothetical protein
MRDWPFTYKDKLACAERELSMRKRAYPRWVAAGKMKAEDASRQIDLMQAIVDDYRDALLAQEQATRLL